MNPIKYYKKLRFVGKPKLKIIGEPLIFYRFYDETGSPRLYTKKPSEFQNKPSPKFQQEDIDRACLGGFFNSERNN